MSDTHTTAHIPDEAVQAIPERIYAKTHGASADVISGQRGLIGGWNEHKRDGQIEYVRADVATAHLSAPCAVEAAVLDDESLQAQISEIGNQIHNLSCEYQSNEPLSERLRDLRGKLWDISKRTAKPVDVAAVREQALEEAAKIADVGMLVPPDGGSPTKGEIDVALSIAAAIRALLTAETTETLTCAKSQTERSNAEPAQAEQWQDMKSAPLNGRSVIVFDSFLGSKDGRGQVIARFDKEHGWHVAASVVGGIYIKLTNPIKWMPLPAAPSTEAGK